MKPKESNYKKIKTNSVDKIKVHNKVWRRSDERKGGSDTKTFEEEIEKQMDGYFETYFSINKFEMTIHKSICEGFVNLKSIDKY